MLIRKYLTWLIDTKKEQVGSEGDNYMLSTEKIYNAKIKFSYLGTFDTSPSQLCYQLGFDYEKGSIATKKIIVSNIEDVQRLLETLDLRNWEEVARKFARIKIENGEIKAIGNVIDNRWVLLK